MPKATQKAVQVIDDAHEATDPYLVLWVKTYDSMAEAVASRGEKLFPGNDTYEKIVDTILENRKQRTSYERDMSAPILNWAG